MELQLVRQLKWNLKLKLRYFSSVKNIEDKIGEIKVDLKAIHECIDANAEETRQMLKSMREQDLKEHSELAGKISVLEKWRWMMMGAGVIVSSLGFNTVASLLK
jgi:RecB family endonuclease NucS